MSDLRRLTTHRGKLGATPEEVAAIQQRLGFGPSPIETLEDVSTGRYVVTTEHGTTHVLDMDRRVAVRRGAVGHEWGDTVFIERPTAAARGVETTPDGTPFRFLAITGATVGQRMRLANDDQWRLTSVVVRIERLGEADADVAP